MMFSVHMDNAEAKSQPLIYAYNIASGSVSQDIIIYKNGETHNKSDLSYNKKTHTLTIHTFNASEYALTCLRMPNDFKIYAKGTSHITCLELSGAHPSKFKPVITGDINSKIILDSRSNMYFNKNTGANLLVRECRRLTVNNVVRLSFLGGPLLRVGFNKSSDRKNGLKLIGYLTAGDSHKSSANKSIVYTGTEMWLTPHKPYRPSHIKVSASSKKATVSFTKGKYAIKTEVAYKTNKGKWQSKMTTKSKLTIKKLKSGKTYFFRIRSYNGKEGNWTRNYQVRVS